MGEDIKTEMGEFKKSKRGAKQTEVLFKIFVEMRVIQRISTPRVKEKEERLSTGGEWHADRGSHKTKFTKKSPRERRLRV